MRQQIEALQAEIRRLIERLDEAEILLQEAAPFCPRRRPPERLTRDLEEHSDLGTRINDFLSGKTSSTTRCHSSEPRTI
jgi:hypothetical protein